MLSVRRCFPSYNPSVDIALDMPALGDDEDILIHPNVVFSGAEEGRNLQLTEELRNRFAGIVTMVLREYHTQA